MKKVSIPRVKSSVLRQKGEPQNGCFKKKNHSKFSEIFFSYFIQSRIFLSVAYLTVANLARLGILVHFQVLVRSQYLVRILSQCQITGGHTIHPPIERLLPLTGIEPTFQNSVSKVAGLQMHATTPGVSGGNKCSFFRKTWRALFS